MLSLWLATVIATTSDQLPADVRRVLGRREQCAHWAGEEPYDRARSDEIAAAMRQLRCSRIERDEARLRRHHMRRPAIVKALDADYPQANDATSFPPRGDPAFGDATAALSYLVTNSTPPPRGIQHFCVIGYRGVEGATAWVHWREANRLILWLGRAGDREPDDSILHSNRNLDLAADVVPTEADIAGSTYRVTGAWVKARLADCGAKGDRYAIPSS